MNPPFLSAPADSANQTPRPKEPETKLSVSDPQKLRNLFKNPPVNSREFRRLKFRNIIYTVGDAILVNNDNQTQDNNFIGKIIKIRSFMISQGNYIVGCLVQW